MNDAMLIKLFSDKPALAEAAEIAKGLAAEAMREAREQIAIMDEALRTVGHRKDQ